MTCRWVTESRLATRTRRVVVASAVLGLATVGSAGVAGAAGREIGHSPANPVVRIAPMAVSVTFDGPLRGRGARMQVLNAGVDVGLGAVTTSAKTLRRELRSGAPGGSYVVEWAAVSAQGQKLHGRFRFTAARGNGDLDGSSSPVPGPVRSRVSTPTEAPASTAAVPEATPTGSPSATATALGTPDWISGPDPVWTPQPTASVTAVAYPGGGAGGPDTGSSVSTGFTAVPLAMGALLVLAAGVISLLNRPRLRD